MRHLLTMFAKAPVAGQVKTRLQPPLTAQQAADLHACFLADQAARLLAPDALPDTTGRISAAGDPDHPSFAELRGLGVQIVPQRGADLGDRMACAIEEGLEDGFDTVTLIGSDSPTLPADLILDARRALLGDAAWAVAPSFDGGYVLIAARTPLPELRGPIAWSSPRTLSETVDALRRAKRLGALGGFWYDVDEAPDLVFLARHLLGPLADRAAQIAPRTAAWLREHGYSDAT